MMYLGRLILIAAACVAITNSLAGSALGQQSSTVNRGVVELETTGSDGISVRIAEDLSRLVDDGATRRLVPVVGKNSLQNLVDLKFLRGIDLAIMQEDVLSYAKKKIINKMKYYVKYL